MAANETLLPLSSVTKADRIFPLCFTGPHFTQFLSSRFMHASVSVIRSPRRIGRIAVYTGAVVTSLTVRILAASEAGFKPSVCASGTSRERTDAVGRFMAFKLNQDTAPSVPQPVSGIRGILHVYSALRAVFVKRVLKIHTDALPFRTCKRKEVWLLLRVCIICFIF